MYREKGKKPPFTRKVIYVLWSNIESRKWRRDDDEVISATKLLREWQEKEGRRTELVELKDEPGLIALAFLLPDLLEKWASRIREISMDSACTFLVGAYEMRTDMLYNLFREYKWLSIRGLRRYGRSVWFRHPARLHHDTVQ